jgi:4'-phosphopantetheinyl transferase
MTMDSHALAVHWWTPEAGFDASLGVPPQARVLAVGVAGQEEREPARRAIRQALRAALVRTCGVPEDAIMLHGAPGEAPHATVAFPDGARRAWLAISHDGALSVAAIRFAGPVGIDVMRVVAVPDWGAVARDYLGPAVLAALAALPAAQREAGFAHAWSEREARLKSLGLPLHEWRAEDEAALQACTCLPLALPEDYAGALALA